MAKLPCVPQSRVFTLKDTGETMSYDQVRQYLMENPDIWLGAKEGKEVAMPKAEKPSAMPGNTNADIANRIRNKKQKGALSAIDFGISVTIYNGALDFMASQVDKGTKLGNAIANTIKWIDEKMAGAKWNKGAFGKYMNDTYSVTLPNGREVEVVRDDSKETAEVINGWYSELEQKILDSKEDKLPAATWAKRLKSKEDEDVWTGVRGFLESKKPSEQVSKKELRDWMKDNRVEISEVVKGEYKGGNLKWAPAREGSKGFLVYDGIDGNNLSIIHNVESDFIYIENQDGEVVFDRDYKDIDEAKEFANSQAKEFAGDTKFSQYQLEGDKENYKEVLVTLPQKISIPDGKYIVYVDKGIKEKREYVKGFDTTQEASKWIAENESKYPSYSLDYEDRKIVLSIEEPEGTFRSSHFDEPNILVHLRMNTRTDANGNKVLFLEEVQSDWGQEGKKKGFDQAVNEKNLSDSQVEDWAKNNGYEVRQMVRMDGTVSETVSELFKNGVRVFGFNRNDNARKIQFLRGEIGKTIGSKPLPAQAPFVTDTNSWTKLGLKVALREAVKQGADKIAWTTGEQQNDRYDLSKQVDEITYKKLDNGDYRVVVYKDGEALQRQDLKENELEANFGKDVAERIINDKGDEDKLTGVKSLSGINLSVGGKGMKGFYGSPSEGNLGIVGNVAKSLFKQEPGTVEIEAGKETIRNWESAKGQGYKVIKKSEYKNADEWTNEYVVVNSDGIAAYSDDTKQSAINGFLKYFSGADLIQPKITTQYSIDITPEMRESVEKGLPLFGTKLSEKQDPVVTFLRSLRSDPNIIGLNAGLWNGFLMAVEKAWLASKSAAEALQAGIQFLKDKKEDLKEWEKYIAPVRERLQQKEQEEAGATPPPTEGGKREMPEGDGMKERGFITSLKEATDISDDVKEGLTGGRSMYKVLPNKITLKEANAILKAVGVDGVTSVIYDSSSDMPFAFKTALAQVAIKKFNEEGRYADAAEVAEVVSELATNLGQGIQALSLFKYLTPQGQLIAAQRAVNKIRQAKFKEHEKQIKKLKAQLEALNKQIVDQAIKNVSQKTQDVATPESQPKGYGESNKIVTKSAFKKALERLRQAKFFTGVPPELIEIAIYHIEAGSREFGDFSRKMVQTVGKKVKPYLKSAYRAAQKRLGGEGYSSDADIATYMTKDIDKDIVSVLRQSGENIQEIIRQHYTVAEEVKQTLSEKLQKKLGLSKKDADAIQKSVSAEFDKLATEKKEKAVGSIYKRLARKKPISKTASQRLIEFSNLGAFDEKSFKEEYAKAMGFPELTPENAATITKLAEKVQSAKEGNPKQKAVIDLLNYRAKLQGISLMDVATSLWMAAILSGPITQAKNIFGNAYNMVTLGSDIIMQSPKDVPFLINGLVMGLVRGGLEGVSVLRTGYAPFRNREDASGVLELKRFMGGAYNPFNYYKYVNRFMMAADAITYEGLREMRARQLALSEAREKYPDNNALQKAIDILNQNNDAYNLAVKEAQDEYNAEVARIEGDSQMTPRQKKVALFNAKIDRSRRVYDLVEQGRPEQLVSETHDFALKGTWNNPPDGALGYVAGLVNQAVRKYPALRFVIPFTNLITNLANDYVNYTPIGFARTLRGGSLTGSLKKPLTEQEKADLMVKAIQGTTLMIATMILSSAWGDDDEPLIEITADGHNDYKKNKELEKTGWRPYSIKVGNRWISYKLTPLAGVLAFVGAYRDYEKYGKGTITESKINHLVAAGSLAMTSILETSFLSSVQTFLSGLLGASKGDEGDKLAEWASKTSASFIPILGTNFYQQVASMVHKHLGIPEKEYRKTYFGKMLRYVPVARDSYQNAVDGLGEELPPQEAGALWSAENKGPYAKLWDLIAEKKSSTGRPDRKGASYIDKEGNEKAMDDEQFYFFSKQRGEYIRTLMMVNYNDIKNMDDAEFNKWMENVRKGANSYALGELALRDEKQIYEKSLQKYEGEANHEKSKVIYAIEANDIKSGKSAYKKYLSLTTKDEDDASRDVFNKIVSDSDILPKGISSDDKQSFYEGLFDGDDEVEITIKKENAEGQVEETVATFKELFSPAERRRLIDLYQAKASSVASKLKKMDEIMDTEYSEEDDGPALWRRYINK